jgi:hypothetical protein
MKQFLHWPQWRPGVYTLMSFIMAILCFTGCRREPGFHVDFPPSLYCLLNESSFYFTGQWVAVFVCRSCSFSYRPGIHQLPGIESRKHESGENFKSRIKEHVKNDFNRSN